jgi:hypothetical protein
MATYNQSAASGKSAHAQWYSDLLPGMIPVALLGSAVYLVSKISRTPLTCFADVFSLQGLQLAREILAHEKYLDEARARVQELEAEVADLRSARQNAVVPSGGKSTLAGSWFRW